MTKQEFEQKCYEAYRLDWMLSHGYTIDDVISGICDIAIEAVSEDPLNAMTDEQAVREMTDACRYELFYERGLGQGSIWACKNEFLDAEFKDVDYMTHLISMMDNSEELEDYWRKEYKICQYSPKSEVYTTAGVLRAYESSDPGQPGICISLQPAGYDGEIDAAYVSVYEDTSYATSDEERPVDVVILSYGDATTEDYTVREIIRREDVVAGLGKPN